MIDVDRSWNHPFSIAGQWWLPERPDDRVAGTIDYENGEIRVELQGTFESTSLLALNVEPRLIPIVNGESFSDRFTLLNCRTVGQNSQIGITKPGSAIESTVDVSIAIVGAIFACESSLKFRHCMLLIERLEAIQLLLDSVKKHP